MIIMIYSVRDNKVGNFHLPFYAHGDVQATRQFHVACKDENIQFSIFPQDFDLYHTGQFNDETGKTESIGEPRFVISGTSFKKVLQGEKDEYETNRQSKKHINNKTGI